MGYSKDIYRRAAKRLERLRAEAARVNDSRAAEAAARLPQLEAIQRELAATAVAVTRLIVTSPEKAAEELGALRDQNRALQESRAALLRGAGYPTDFLVERRACDICGGSGYMANGGMCECHRALLREEALAALHEVSQAKNCTFGAFDLTLYPNESAGTAESPRRHMADVLDACKRYAAEFSRESPSLLMLGKTGLGKTHLSLAICTALVEKGFGVVYTPVQKLTDKLESGKFSYSDAAKEQYAAGLESATSCDLLVLDDLGAEFTTQFSAAALYNIVNTRMVENRPTIISTNLEPQEIEQKYSPRMSSRLMGGCHALRFTGRDIRFEKKFRG